MRETHIQFRKNAPQFHLNVGDGSGASAFWPGVVVDLAAGGR